MQPSHASRLAHHTGRTRPRLALAGALTLLLTLFACDQAQRSTEDRSVADEAPLIAPAPPVRPERDLSRDGGRVGGGVGRGAPGSQPSLGMADKMEQAPAPVAPTGGASSVDAANNVASGTAPAGQLVTAADMIIRTGQVAIEVRALDSAITRLRELTRSLGGYIANTSMESGTEQIRSATIEIKLPAARFDQALAGMNALGRVESANTSAQDVGEEYVDLSARVANARRLEERLIELLARRTGKLEEVLNVERELARVREEIERYEGRMRYLRTRAAVSTLTIMLHEPRPVLGPPRSPGVIAEAFRQAWRNFVGLLAGLIAASGVLVPLAGVVVLVWWLIRRWREMNPPAPARARRAVPPSEDADRAA
jgi:hypothetical protein